MQTSSLCRKFSSSFRCLKRFTQLTSERYEEQFKLKRLDYSVLTNADIQFFERLLNSTNVLQGDDVEGYNTDWMGIFRGASRCVLRPETTEQVSAIIRHCYDRNLAVCPQGGNTGLVGGSTPIFDEIILSTKRMNREFEFDPLTGIVQCQSGWILEAIDDKLSDYDYMVPLDLGSKGSCNIGGNVSTAAGGMRLFRYGSLHANVLGLEVVLPDKHGTVLDCKSALRKDNTGFHLPHLFVGAEGALGLVTSVVLNCVPKPSSVNLAVLGCESFEKCCTILQEAKTKLAEILSSFEFMDTHTMDCVVENLKLNRPLGTKSNFYLLIETSGSSQEHDGEKLSDFLEICLNKNLAQDGVQAQNEDQRKKFWRVRESGAEALLYDGYCYKQDLSLPLNKYYEVCDVMRERLKDTCVKRVVGYGHLADGNVHLNVTSREYSKEISDKMYPFLYEWVAKHGGSISAEHGVGLVKRDYIHFSKSPAALEQMRKLKKFYDPKLLLNPYKTVQF